MLFSLLLSLAGAVLRAATSPFRLVSALYTLLIGRPHFLVALLETLACVATAATARPPLAAAATVLSTQPWLWWGTAGLSTAAGYLASAGVAFLALYTAGARAGDEDVAHAVAALVWGPLWWSAAASGVPALFGRRGGGRWFRRASVLLGRLLVTALYAKATSAARWAGPRGGAGGADWEGEAHPVLPALGPDGGGRGGGGGGPAASSSSDALARVLGGGDLYAVLGIPRDAPAAAVRAARARALRACHPDKASAGADESEAAPSSTSNLAAAAAVERITRAAALLSDEGRRSEYDARLARWEAALAVTESLPVTPPVGFRGSESGGVRQ